MAWLDQRQAEGQDTVRYDELAEFRMGDTRIPLMDRQRGIRKPANLEAALSFRTTYTPPNQVPPYQDAEGSDGLLRYKYRGEDPQHPENIALRRAFEKRLPLIWFVGIASGVYEAVYPVWLVADEPEQLQFVVAVDEAQRFMPNGVEVAAEQRRYAERLTQLRLHQPVFRARVLTAYGVQCAICRLRHADLLDAAHILPDTHPNGSPVVPNGLSLCKIHHAAYDKNILGIRPDLVVEIQRRVLDEVDGPMLRHGLQDMEGVRLQIPRSRDSQPDPLRLTERYTEFRDAS